jgi:hypothetical protein
LLSRATCSCRCQAPAWPTMRDELQCASSPGLGKRKRAAGLARNRQCLEAGRFEILAKHADRIAANHVLWSWDGVRSNRNAAGQRFELNDAECVGSARENEYVCRRKMCGQGFPFQLAEKVRVRETAPQLARLRSVANDDLRACRSSARNAARFFSTARRPTLTKIGRGRSIAAARSGVKRSVSTPRVHIAKCAKPRLPSSSIKERVDTIVTAAAA